MHTHITHTVLSFIWAFFNEYPEIQLRNRWIFFCFQLCNCNWPHITTTDKLFHFHLSWISLSFAVVLSQWRCHSVNEYILPVQRHKFSNYPFNLLFLIEFRIVNNTKSLSFDLLALLNSHHCECISHWWCIIVNLLWKKYTSVWSCSEVLLMQ